MQNGCARFAISVCRQELPSFSNNGEDCVQNPGGANLMIKNGMVFLQSRLPTQLQQNDKKTKGQFCWPLGQRKTGSAPTISQFLHCSSQKSGTLAARHRFC